MSKRCFIAINLLPAAVKEIDDLTLKLKKYYKNSVTGVQTKTAHLTLHFLGDLSDSQIEAVKDILENQVKDFKTAKLLTDKISAFPNLNEPKIIYLSGQQIGNESLSLLQNKVGEELNKIGIKTENRPWTPHLTLARVKSPIIFKPDNFDPPKLEIPVTSIELMASQLSSIGPEYKILASYNLKY
ncbi:MAG: RNA 2',3'-cyclic phosphodiesterase [Candidatus Buchananbacteria bacterium]